jgi:hypothetical protein
MYEKMNDLLTYKFYKKEKNNEKMKRRFLKVI